MTNTNAYFTTIDNTIKQAFTCELGKAYTHKRFSFNIKNIEDCYRLIFINLIEKFPEKQDLYETLLKLNDNNYRNTVLQIELERKEHENVWDWEETK